MVNKRMHQDLVFFLPHHPSFIIVIKYLDFLTLEYVLSTRGDIREVA